MNAWERRCLSELADIWSDPSLRRAFALDSHGCPLEDALAAWHGTNYETDGPNAREVLTVVRDIADDAGPDCYPQLWEHLDECGGLP